MVNEDPKKDTPERKLLYVVGVYPEWEKKIAAFKKKWGKKGEKYLSQPNVYIHGDVEEPIQKVDTRRKAYILENGIKVPDGGKYLDRIRKMNDDEMRNYIPSIYLEKFKQYNDTYMSEAEFNNREKFIKEHFNTLIPDDYTNWSRSYDKGNRKVFLEKSDNLDRQNINNEEDKKNRNLGRIHARVSAKNIGSDDDMTYMSDKFVKTPAKKSKIAINYWTPNEASEDIIDYEDFTDGNYVLHADMKQKTKVPRTGFDSKTKNDVPTFENDEQSRELKWLKEVFIPRILNQRRSGEMKKNANFGDDNSIEILKKKYPLIERRNEKYMLYDNVTKTEEMQEGSSLDSKSNDSPELTKKKIKNKLVEETNANTRFSHINEGATKKNKKN